MNSFYDAFHAFFAMDAPYRSGINVRLSFCWDSPTSAGVFFASVLPLLWSFSSPGRSKFLRAIAAGLEIAVAVALLKTYSRGAFVAVLLSYIAFLCILLWKSSGRARHLLTGAGIRVVVLLGLTSVVQSYTRFSPEYLSDDRSVASRATLWRAAFRMTADSPLTGWGQGASGISFTDWYEDPGDFRLFRGMVNTFLDLACEHGLVALFLVLWVLAAAALSALADARLHRSETSAAAAASLCAFTLAASFVSIGSSPSLLIVPALVIALVCVVSGVRKVHPSWTRPLTLAAVCSAAVCLAVFGTGRLLSAGDPIRVHPLDDTWVSVRRVDARQPGRPLLLVPTAACAGRQYGRLVRDLLQDSSMEQEIQVARSESSPPRNFPRPARLAILLGESFSVGGVEQLERVALVHPFGEPPAQWPARLRTVVALPAFDPLGLTPVWEQWARDHAATVLHTGAIGPAVTAEILRQVLHHESL